MCLPAHLNDEPQSIPTQRQEGKNWMLAGRLRTQLKSQGQLCIFHNHVKAFAVGLHCVPHQQPLCGMLCFGPMTQLNHAMRQLLPEHDRVAAVRGVVSDGNALQLLKEEEQCGLDIVKVVQQLICTRPGVLHCRHWCVAALVIMSKPLLMHLHQPSADKPNMGSIVTPAHKGP